MQPLTPSRRNTKSTPLSAQSKQTSIIAYASSKDTHETTESPKKPLATITNKSLHKIPESPERKADNQKLAHQSQPPNHACQHQQPSILP
ncbi:hypothetical protein K450DRAFT_253398 [Umbelopsis ramanniana AG]|uniref:Uncharacterized protein n=1 Tax=Umbelopsis ramanniana AG TaxID=1314678 RepID=A0AAD5E6F0_UMBRA|nr:uncharacterized protein K450DRAFT_253398 [Umbelopsis ramanniana AG]KAI8577205.1 hypothetical protein K450DRAFT_253398 [Umbelopsis ramanniana AG]